MQWILSAYDFFEWVRSQLHKLLSCCIADRVADLGVFAVPIGQYLQ